MKNRKGRDSKYFKDTSSFWQPRAWGKLRLPGKLGKSTKPSWYGKNYPNSIVAKTVLKPLPKGSKANSRKRRKRRWYAKHPIESS
jgi:hypothetical protein